MLCSGSAGGYPIPLTVRRWDAGADGGRAQDGPHCCWLHLVDSLPSHPSLLPPTPPSTMHTLCNFELRFGDLACLSVGFHVWFLQELCCLSAFLKYEIIFFLSE